MASNRPLSTLTASHRLPNAGELLPDARQLLHDALATVGGMDRGASYAGGVPESEQ